MPKTNNFDLIRLAAALQVVLEHSIEHLQIDVWNWATAVIRLFPGVPIFFFISGFLISKSFENNPVLKEFALNRILRIYPGLVICFLVSLGIAGPDGLFPHDADPVARELLLWSAAQVSVGQFYNPEFMRHFGVGVLNGSMWTITVELQFYALVPMTYGLLRLRQASRLTSNCLLLALVLIFLLANRWYFYGAPRYSQELWYKLAGVSFAPWFYMFVVGILFQRNFAVLERWFAGRFLPSIAVYCAAVAAGGFMGWGTGNALHPVLFVVLCVALFAAAFSCRGLSDRLLARNDLSYGVYIYHMPVINGLLFLGMGAGNGSLAIAVVSTLVLAYASWRLVEKPALGFKRHPLYRHGSAVA